MSPPTSNLSPPAPRRWLWPIGVEWRALAAGGAAPARNGQVVRYTLPERLLGPEPADCEVVLGEDYGERVLERALPRDSWWLWWTEKPLLARLARQAAGVRRARHLPESIPNPAPARAAPAEERRAAETAWVASGLFRTFGAALLPPGSPLQAGVLESGASPYSEVDPNFWIGMSPLASWSPRALEAWCARAAPSSLSLDPFAQGAERLCMVYDGDISIALLEVDAAALLDALEQWAGARGVTLDLQTASEAPRAPAGHLREH